MCLRQLIKEKACQVLKETNPAPVQGLSILRNEIHIFGQEQDVKQILKELTLADVDIDEIYYARQNLEEYFTQLVQIGEKIMIHTIQADFYRLFRSKGFWITEFILFLLMLMGAVFGATGQLMAIQTEEPDIPIQGWNGIQALINASSQGSNLVFLCIVLACLVLGVDLIGKLYKNNLTVGVSRTEFSLPKPLYWLLLHFCKSSLAL